MTDKEMSKFIKDMEDTTKRLNHLHKTMKKTYSKSYTIDWNPDGIIILFDNFEEDEEEHVKASYSLEDDGEDYFKEFTEEVESIIGMTIDWIALEDRGSMTFCW